MNRDIYLLDTLVVRMCLRGFDRLEKSFLSSAERCLTNGFLAKSDHPELLTGFVRADETAEWTGNLEFFCVLDTLETFNIRIEVLKIQTQLKWKFLWL